VCAPVDVGVVGREGEGSGVEGVYMGAHAVVLFLWDKRVLL
jgi:hypothetical protein